jgi:hypothetical protein
MNRLVLGVLCGVVFGLIDVLMTVFGKHPDVSRTMLWQAFSSRLAVGVLAATVTLPVHPVLAGAIVGFAGQPFRRVWIEFLRRGAGDRSAFRRADGVGGEDVGNLKMTASPSG